MLVGVYRNCTVRSLSSVILLDTTYWLLGFDKYGYVNYNNQSRVVLYSVIREAYLLGEARQMVLDILIWLRLHMDRSLSFRSSCCEGVCGSCAMLINNENTLACIQPIWLIGSYVLVYPLPHFSVIRDLVVDLKSFYSQYSFIRPYYINFDNSGYADTVWLSLFYRSIQLYSIVNLLLFIDFIISPNDLLYVGLVCSLLMFFSIYLFIVLDILVYHFMKIYSFFYLVY